MPFLTARALHSLHSHEHHSLQKALLTRDNEVLASTRLPRTQGLPSSPRASTLAWGTGQRGLAPARSSEPISASPVPFSSAWGTTAFQDPALQSFRPFLPCPS